ADGHREQLRLAGGAAGRGEHVGIVNCQYAFLSRDDPLHVWSEGLVLGDRNSPSVVLEACQLRKSVGSPELSVSIATNQQAQDFGLRALRIHGRPLQGLRLTVSPGRDYRLQNGAHCSSSIELDDLGRVLVQGIFGDPDSEPWSTKHRSATAETEPD